MGSQVCMHQGESSETLMQSRIRLGIYTLEVVLQNNRNNIHMNMVIDDVLLFCFWFVMPPHS